MTETRVQQKVIPSESESGERALGGADLTGDETVDEIVLRHPQLRTVLMAYGLCTCCSGSLSLRRNAEAHGIPLSELLEDLERELAKDA